MTYATFESRRISAIGTLDLRGTTFKRYGVDCGDGRHDAARFTAALALALAAVPEPDAASGRPAAGFLIEHQGRTGDYLVVCWWDRENELPIRVWVREGGLWRPAGSSESVCVWDLEIVWFERQAWIETMLGGVDVDRGRTAYLSRAYVQPPAVPPIAPAAPKPTVAAGVIEQVDLRVGTITAIAAVPDSDELMRLTVDFGLDVRTVVAGIRQERSQPDLLVGRQALFYYNLAPRTLRGARSEAMLCDVGYADGLLPALLQPEWPVPNGSRAG